MINKNKKRMRAWHPLTLQKNIQSQLTYKMLLQIVQTERIHAEEERKLQMKSLGPFP